MAAMLRDLAQRRFSSYAPAIHAASHVGHEKRVVAEMWRSEGPSSGAPYPSHIWKVKETHELIFSWLSWLAVLLVGAYANAAAATESRNMVVIL